jgi:diguanylate cyclase (GGDEF)-like protein
MRSRLSFLFRVTAVFVFSLIVHWSQAEQPSPQIAWATPVVIQGLGNGTVSLHGPWRFHLGDDPSWAKPAFDDSAWALLSGDRPWGQQGYMSVTGLAWYRLRIALTPAPGVPAQFSLLLPSVDDAYEVYWNGSLIGRSGALPPSHPVWYVPQAPKIFSLGHAQSGVLALRVWKAPLLSDDSGERGGFEAVPEIGSPAAIATANAAIEYHWLLHQQFLFGEALVYVLIALLSGLAWWHDRSRRLLFWMTGFALAPPLNLLLLYMHLPLPYVLAMGLSQPVFAIQDISLWFLLLWVLLLHEVEWLSRLTRIFAAIYLASTIMDGVLIAMSWNPHWMDMIKRADAAFACLINLLGAFPLILVGYALLQRKRLNFARWLVAILAFLDEMIVVVEGIVKQGRQFTGWNLADKIDSALFTIDGSAISLHTVIGALLLVAIVYAVYNSVREDQRRQEVLEREKAELMGAREQMRHHAEHDDLTGLWNHRIIVERLRTEMERSRRDGTTLSVLLADIDHFKNVNDSFGHPAGDCVLKEISDILMRSVRTYDWVGRYGGEEFLLILPGSEFENACTRAEELRRAVESTPIPCDGETLHVTSSFGVTSNFPADCEAEAVIRAVDEALYRAKHKGRNCVIATDMEVAAGEA